MNRVAVTLAKLSGIEKRIEAVLANPNAWYLDPPKVVGLFQAYENAAQVLREDLPELFDDLPHRTAEITESPKHHDGRGYVLREQLEQLAIDIECIWEVRAHSELQPPQSSTTQTPRIFISHGGNPDWMEVQSYVEKDLNILTLELAQEPNLGRTILQKLVEEADKCSYAIIVMTGEDETTEGELRTRENVMHEIGYFQGRFGLDKVCLLHEEGVNVPSNILGVVYIPFPAGLASASFGALARELRAAVQQ